MNADFKKSLTFNKDVQKMLGICFKFPILLFIPTQQSRCFYYHPTPWHRLDNGSTEMKRKEMDNKKIKAIIKTVFSFQNKTEKK